MIQVDLRKLLTLALASLAALWLLFSCSAEQHLIKMEKHRVKALNKGAEIRNDIDTITETDTLVVTYTRNDTTYIEKTITNTVEIASNPVYVTKWDRRKEYQLAEKVVKLEAKADRLQKRLDKRVDVKEEKTKRTEVRQENKRSNWFIWLLIGIGVGLILLFVWKIARNYIGL